MKLRKKALLKKIRMMKMKERIKVKRRAIKI